MHKYDKIAFILEVLQHALEEFKEDPTSGTTWYPKVLDKLPTADIRDDQDRYDTWVLIQQDIKYYLHKQQRTQDLLDQIEDFRYHP